MAIRINLLAEQQYEEELRRRDPVQRGYWIAGFVVALMLLWAIFLQVRVWSAAAQVRRLDRQWRALETKATSVKTDVRTTVEIMGKLQALQRLSEERFLWGPVLNALQFCLVDNIQVTKLQSVHGFLYTPEVKLKDKVKGQPATATETNTLTLVARCYDSEASLEKIDQMVRNLKTHEYLKTLFTNESGVRMKSRAAPQPDTAQIDRTYVEFTLECIVPERVRQP